MVSLKMLLQWSTAFQHSYLLRVRALVPLVSFRTALRWSTACQYPISGKGRALVPLVFLRTVMRWSTPCQCSISVEGRDWCIMVSLTKVFHWSTACQCHISGGGEDWYALYSSERCCLGWIALGVLGKLTLQPVPLLSLSYRFSNLLQTYGSLTTQFCLMYTGGFSQITYYGDKPVTFYENKYRLIDL